MQRILPLMIAIFFAALLFSYFFLLKPPKKPDSAIQQHKSQIQLMDACLQAGGECAEVK